MKIFEFEGGQKLKVTTADYDLLKKAASLRWEGIAPGAPPLIDQIRDSLKVDAFGYISSVTKSFSPDSCRIVNRLVLNQLLKFMRTLKVHPNELTE